MTYDQGWLSGGLCTPRTLLLLTARAEAWCRAYLARARGECHLLEAAQLDEVALGGAGELEVELADL